MTEIRPPVAVTLASLSLSPASVSGCGSTTITATLSGAAPAGGSTVTLTQSPSGAILLTSITVAAGATTGTATIAQRPSANVFAVFANPITITGSLGTSTQSTTLNLVAPIAIFTVTGTARGVDACQISNSSGNSFDCTFNGGTSAGAATWDWSWQIGNQTRAATSRTTPTFQPDTGGCGFFGSPAQGSNVQMQVFLTVRDGSGNVSCQRENLNVRVFSGGFCGGF